MSPSPARSVYLGRAEPVTFGQFHAADPTGRCDTAVLMCPPFGWDDVCSYRSRREWARALASGGRSTLRIDLPGTGDSAGQARLKDWTTAVDAAARWLLDTTGCTRVVGIGIGIGGLVLGHAVATGAPLDELVLWAVPSRGRSLIRELRAFARLEESYATGPGQPDPVVPPQGHAGAGGFTLSRQATGELEQLDLARSGPATGVKRALLLGRDGTKVDEALSRHLDGAGAEVTILPGYGYGAMMAEPQEARAPTTTFAQVSAWLDDGRSARSDRAPQTAQRGWAPDAHPTLDVVVADGRVRETPLWIEQPFGHLFGVLAEPSDAVPAAICAVLLNAGAIRRIGPNRMWVDLARSWAAKGVATLRLDVEGIGDADGDEGRFADVAELYVPRMVDQVVDALSAMQTRGVADRFVLGGLCSGAYWSFHAALRDERVGAALMLNPRTLFWDPSLEPLRKYRLGLQRRSGRRMSTGDLRRDLLVAAGRSAPHALLALIRHSWRRHTRINPLISALDRLRDMDKRLLLAFSGEEPLHWELMRDGVLDQRARWPQLEVALLPGRDHTLKPATAQEGARAALNEALSRELDHTPVSPDQAAGSHAHPSTRTPILILGLAGLKLHHGALGIIRSAGALSIPVYHVRGPERSPLDYSHFSSGALVIPYAATIPQTLEQLRAFSRGHGRAIIVPVDDESAVFLNEHASELEDDFILPRLPPGLATALASKRMLLELCERNGVATPRATFPESEAEVLADAARWGYPIVAKRILAPPAHASGPRVLVVHNRHELLTGFRSMSSSGSGGTMLQQYVPATPGSDWMYNAYFDAGSRPLAAFTGRKLRQSPPGTGATTLGVCEANPALRAIVEPFMAAIGYRGQLDVDLRLDASDNTYKLLDANPRIGASFRLFVGTGGIDLLHLMYLDLTGQSLPSTEQQEGRRWLAEPTDIHSSLVASRRGELNLRAWARSVRDVDETAWWSRDDPGPFLAALSAFVATAARMVRNGRTEPR